MVHFYTMVQISKNYLKFYEKEQHTKNEQRTVSYNAVHLTSYLKRQLNVKAQNCKISFAIIAH